MLKSRATTGPLDWLPNSARTSEGCVWEADDRAMHAAREAKACADYARHVTERGQARLREVEQARREIGAEIEREIEQACRNAEAARRRALARVEEATRKLDQARQLVSEAVATTDRRQPSFPVWQLTQRSLEGSDDAEQQASGPRRAAGRDWQAGERALGSESRTELVMRAAGLGIKKPTNLTKSQLADAIATASSNHRPT